MRERGVGPRLVPHSAPSPPRPAIEQIRAIACEDEMHLSAFCELDDFCQFLSSCCARAPAICAWLASGGKRRKRTPARLDER